MTLIARISVLLPFLLASSLLSFNSFAEETISEDEQPEYTKHRDVPERFIQQQQTDKLSFVITPHRRNYILPISHQESPNNEPWIAAGTYRDEQPFQHNEIKLQISFKVPLLEDRLFNDGDGIYFGFTSKSFWQAYNSNISAPFRETNYRPEIFYQTPFYIDDIDGAFFFRTGIEHESNGRSQLLSRSWNRAFVGLGYATNGWALYLQPWYRLPEDAKEDDGDPSTPPPAKGDDNPDIEDYYGHFELTAVYKRDNYQVASIIRANTSTHKGAVELNYSFPLHGRLRGLVQYFDGYGESMIDYDYRVQRYSLGILLTELL
ncbi:hypothetical protein A3715_12080 [Oleiphilus sp. HI0009]|uniref:phospholipase A n=2 Tax=Oleiphilus sp. HI0125 TaxID=1822266 RepID=UPI0007C33E6C|nr:phospholipase A [Oleiphilus sp. HI0125]KZX77029.1 hypothetical protein A3715_12080 [Oleiphilus sp. HI0009]KZZ57187.1 hypothetical protein A3762_10320 [Oleiphilus sp. HI0125]